MTTHQAAVALMATHQAAVALMEWALEQAGVAPLGADGLKGGYPYEPLGKSIALPDVVVEIRNVARRQAGDDPRFPQWNIQQRLLVAIWEADLSVMADVGETEDENAAAALTVRTIADTLLDAIWADLTLGARFDGTHIEPTADFTPGWVTYPDGSTGRNSTIHLTVAKLAGE